MRWRLNSHNARAGRGGIRPAGALILAFCLWTGPGGPASAQVCGTPRCGGAGGGGTAVKPLSVTLLQNLDYGLVGSTSISGSVTVDSATGTKTLAGGALDLGGIHTRAYFEIRGQKGRSFSITLPGSLTMTAPGGATTTITGIESTPSFTGTLSGSGKAWVYVGGVLQVGGAQQAGAYNNIFDITVDYVP